MATHEFKTIIHCEQCHTAFDATRMDARFCSAKCRKAAQRARDRVTGIEFEIIGLLNELTTFKKTDLNCEAKAVIDRIVKRSDNIATYWS